MQVTHKRRQFRQDVTRYRAAIATPVTGAFKLPATARLFLKSTAGCAAGTTAATILGPSATRTIRTPLLAAGGVMPIGWIEKDRTITPAVGFDLLIDSGLAKLVKIGAG